MNQNKNCFKNDVATCERCVLVLSVAGMVSSIACIIYALLGV